MSTALATRSDNGAVMPTSERDRLTRNLILKNATDDQLKLVLGICERYNFDPLLKHVVIISGSIYVTRDGLMHIAHASGQLDGMEVEATRDEEGLWTATCRVWRKDMSRPFVYSTYQSEQQNASSPVWKTAPRAMTIKTAEVACLRRAFDVSLGGAEEVGYDGKTSRLGEVIDVTAAPNGAAPSAPSRPRAASATAAPQPAPAAPPKRKKEMTPEETISIVRDETQPLERRINGVSYLFSQARDTETLNSYFATIMQYADSVDGLAHGGAALGNAATEAFHAREEALIDFDAMVPTGQAPPVAAEA